MCTSSVSNVIYHKFSHGAAFYTLNGENVNVMLELVMVNISLPLFLSSRKALTNTASLSSSVNVSYGHTTSSASWSAIAAELK